MRRLFAALVLLLAALPSFGQVCPYTTSIAPNPYQTARVHNAQNLAAICTALVDGVGGGLDPDGTSGGLTLKGGLLTTEGLMLRPNAADAAAMTFSAPFDNTSFLLLRGDGDVETGSVAVLNSAYTLVSSSTTLQLFGQTGVSMSATAGNVNITAADGGGSIIFTTGGTSETSLTPAGDFGAVRTVFITPIASPPYACDAGHEGWEYADTSHAKCYCDGTSWNKLTGSGAGTCS